jgi:hypothetical protein
VPMIRPPPASLADGNQLLAPAAVVTPHHSTPALQASATTNSSTTSAATGHLVVAIPSGSSASGGRPPRTRHPSAESLIAIANGSPSAPLSGLSPHDEAAARLAAVSKRDPLSLSHLSHQLPNPTSAPGWLKAKLASMEAAQAKQSAKARSKGKSWEPGLSRTTIETIDQHLRRATWDKASSRKELLQASVVTGTKGWNRSSTKAVRESYGHLEINLSCVAITSTSTCVHHVLCHALEARPGVFKPTVTIVRYTDVIFHNVSRRYIADFLGVCDACRSRLLQRRAMEAKAT